MEKLFKRLVLTLPVVVLLSIMVGLYGYFCHWYSHSIEFPYTVFYSGILICVVSTIITILLELYFYKKLGNVKLKNYFIWNFILIVAIVFSILLGISIFVLYYNT